MTTRPYQTAFFALAVILGCAGGAQGQGAAPKPNSTSPLATNLEVLADYSEEWTFVDAFRSSRPWVSGSSVEWDDGRALNTDANGWVASLEAGQVARTAVLGSIHPYPAGNYIVLYDGQGTLEYGAAAILDSVQSRPGRHVLQMDPAKRGILISLTATTPGNPIRNIRVIMPGGTCAGDPFRYAKDASSCAGAGYFMSFEANYRTIVFHPRFLERVRTYRALRFMDWGRTNGSTQAVWSGRPKLSDAHWTTDKGVPVEVMVDLANRIGAHAWFTLPHLADDNYVTQYAMLVKQKLRPDLKAYVEYSNEVWNGFFDQAAYAQKQGLALGLAADPFKAQLFFYSKRSVQIFDIWSNQMGDPARLVRVMAAQATNPWTSVQVLDFQNAKQKTDTLAVAPYFGGYLGTLKEQGRVQAMSLNQLFAELDKVALPQAFDFMLGQKSVANSRSIALIAYEGGQHLAGQRGVENDAAINKLFDDANRDPRMGDLYKKYLDGWKASGGTLMAHYVHCGGYSKWGRWGALEYLEQPRNDSPKFNALQNYIEQNPAWW